MASPEKSLGKKKKSSGKTSRKSKGKKHKIRAMHIEPADNGGFVARHDYAPESDDSGASMSPDSTTHALASPDDLLNHVQDNFGGGAGGGMPQGPTGAGAVGV